MLSKSFTNVFLNTTDISGIIVNLLEKFMMKMQTFVDDGVMPIPIDTLFRYKEKQ